MQCKRPITRTRKDKTEFQHRCGQCIFCRVTKSQEWAFRLLLEAQHTTGMCLFTTQTYMPERLPMTSGGLPTVRMDDMREFIRKLRRNTGWDVRYLAATEYGKRPTYRPHGHAALFIEGADLAALNHWEPKGENRRLLESHKIRWRQYGQVEREILRAWGCKGSVSVSEFNQHRAAYVAKYLAKQATDLRSLHPDQEPEGLTMSPGLGKHGARPLAETIEKMGGTLLELKKPGILVDVSTWSIDIDRQPIGVRNAHHRDKKTYPVHKYIRDKVVAHLGGDQRSESEKVAELQFQTELRRLDVFTKRESKAEKFERITRRRLLAQGEL